MDCIFDIDGTLANAAHRLHHVVRPENAPDDWKKDWDAFLADELTAQDAPIQPLFHLLEEMLFSRRFRVFFLTGRKESSRVMTAGWITRHMDKGVPPMTLRQSVSDRLYMRSEDDRRPSSEVKRDLLWKLRRQGLSPELVFEDRKDDTAMWRSEGLVCCQVAEGDY